MEYINLIFISFICVYIINKSGFILSLSKFLYNLFNKDKWNYQMIGKPFSCASCMTLWISLFYLLNNDNSLLYSLFLSVVNSGIIVILIDKLYNLLIKLLYKIK